MLDRAVHFGGDLDLGLGYEKCHVNPELTIIVGSYNYQWCLAGPSRVRC